MGVSGSGKTTIGRALAQALGVAFVEGDELHPQRNVARMAAGVALTDADRGGWLDAIALGLARAAAADESLVVSCSALRRAYRDRMRAAAPGLRFVYLHGAPPLLRQRLAGRRGHYMPASLLPSQLETLEPPGADENAVAFDIAEAPAAIVRRVVQSLEQP